MKRVVDLYKGGMKMPEIYDLVFSRLDKERTTQQKRVYIQVVLQRAGCLRDTDERSRFMRDVLGRKPRTWNTKSRWAMKK